MSIPSTVKSSRSTRRPRDPRVRSSSLFSTRNTNRLNASVTNASHGPWTRSAGMPISTLNAMLTMMAIGIVSRNGRSGRSTLMPHSRDLTAGIKEDRCVGADAEERGLSQRDLACEALRQVHPDHDDCEHHEDAHVDHGRVGAPDREHDEECEEPEPPQSRVHHPAVAGLLRHQRDDDDHCGDEHRPAHSHIQPVKCDLLIGNSTRNDRGGGHQRRERRAQPATIDRGDRILAVLELLIGCERSYPSLLGPTEQPLRAARE